MKSNPKILFIDDGDIELMRGVERVIHPGKKYEGNPVVVADKTWEGSVIVSTVRKEGNLYRMWYQGVKEVTYPNLYAESQDGIKWTKPILRQYEDFTGSLENNIYLSRLALRSDKLGPVPVNQDHNQSVLYTPHLGRNKKYTMLSYDYGRSGYSAYDGYFLAFSRDGIKWTDGPQESVIPGHADVGWFMFDEKDKKFCGIVKTFLNIRGYSRRSVLWTESEDGFNWLLPKPALIPDLEDEKWTEGKEGCYTQFYGMPIFRYEELILGFLQIFKCTDGHTSSDGTIDVQLTCSRDGKNWQRVGNRQPILERGGDDSWDWGMVWTGNSLVIENENVHIYFSGTNCTHNGYNPNKAPERISIGMATWQKDRFVGLSAGEKSGEISIPSVVNGRRLHVNANANKGTLMVSITGENGQIIKGAEYRNCLPLREAALDSGICWRDNLSLSRLKGKRVHINVKLTNAEIFSLWWE